MASSDNIPAKDNKASETKNVETEKSKSTPPTSESANKRKRESVVGDDTNETEEKHVELETVGMKEVEMKDAEPIKHVGTTLVDQSQSTKEIEMKDADDVACDKTDVEEKVPEIGDHEPTSCLNENEGSKEEEEHQRKVEVSESIEKLDNNNGLSEVATLLKQVQESDKKAKVEIEVKVKKMDDGVVNGEDPKREPGLVKEEDPNHEPGRVSCA